MVVQIPMVPLTKAECKVEVRARDTSLNIR